jgi:hypothetical protein
MAGKRNYKLRIRFNAGTGWWAETDNYLGWPREIYYEYPCIISGTAIATALKTRCDLVSGSNNNAPSYIDVYGFKTTDLVLTATLHVEIPKIKIRANADCC